MLLRAPDAPLDPRERPAWRRERTLSSAQHRDGRFANPAGAMKMGFDRGFQVSREWFASKAVRRPPAPLPVVSPLEGWRAQSRTGMRATWLGHSTVLLEIDGARVLTDPVWADRASPSQLFGPRRFHAPVVELDQLPPLDAIVLSHDHYDHLDAAAVAALARQSWAPWITALGVGARLEALGVPHDRVIELDWWQQVQVPGVDLLVTATPAQHFSGRSAFDRDETLWSSLVLQGPRHRVFFSGDTGLEPQFARIGELLGPFDLVMLEVGAFNPAWGHVHLGPWAAQDAHRALGGGPLLPVHWSTFDLALHAWDEPIRVLAEAAASRELPLVAPRLGEVRELGDADEVRRRALALDAWWEAVSPGGPRPG